jgi:NAD(P)-dependent dehydrogenase (short-subunit alcohol dehydrogenase family)
LEKISNSPFQQQNGIIKNEIGRHSMTNFSGKVAIITGATGFLASGVIPIFCDAGANLVLSGNKETLLNRFPELEGGSKHRLSPVDLTDPDAIDVFVKNALSKFGRIDVLVNIVGGWDAGQAVHETSIDTWDQMMSLNAKTTFLMSQAVIPTMLEQGSGKIVNIGAKPGLSASGHDAAYAASKAAVLRLTESMSHEYKKRGININAVLPASFITAERYAENPTSGITPKQLGHVIAFLCSDEASIIHGAIIPAYGQKF